MHTTTLKIHTIADQLWLAKRQEDGTLLLVCYLGPARLTSLV